MSESRLTEILTQGLQQLGEDPSKHPIDTYFDYIRLLLQWNKTYNLTAITDPEKIITHHILDSLSVLPYVKGERCIDIGTGAGLPGCILALARPSQQWTLLDSNNKKTRFINQCKIELKQTNVTIVHGRVEDYQPNEQFQVIISRAFSSLDTYYQSVKHLKSTHGRILAMKGAMPKKEVTVLEKIGIEVKVVAIQVPGLDAQRHLLSM